MKRLLLLLVPVLIAPVFAADREDILIADFEGETYGPGWKTTGTAFGKGPTKGTLPNQMPVSGYLGKGLVNSYLGGDASTGTLTSPPFKIERKYLNFLVGGGKKPGKTCVNLLVDGKVARTATGSNDKPGGTERLDWHSWDVGELEGKEATIEIVDNATGGWGHINADHFVQSDKKKQAEAITRTFQISSRYLHLPVKNGAPLRRMKYVIDGQTVREFDIELADGEQPDFWAFADVSEFKGKTLAVETVLTSGSKSLEAIVVADDVPQAEKLYREKHRPLFHFTSRFGWLNDPNGLVFVPRDGKAGTDGEWHMFYQHNPFGVNWGNMHWGHAVSEDLMHWRELGIGLYPKNYGDWAFSGSAIIDTENTSGWGTKDAPPLVLAYTSTARGECIAYSKDKGRTWKEHDRNPVVKHSGRDPKLLWHEKTKHWVMAVYDEFQGKQWIAFYTSPDLKTWTFASRIEGFFECPDLYELPYESAQLQQFKSGKWVLSAADGKYLTGKFDGKEFKPDSREKKQLWYGHFYAAQTFNDFVRPQQFVFDPPRLNLPSSPLIQIGWENGVSFPGMSFNQQMSIPVSLSWWSINLGDAPRLRAIPFNVESLHEKEVELSIDVNDEQAGRNWGPDKPGEVLKKPLAENLDAFDLETEIELGNAKKITFDLRGTKLGYDVAAKKLSCKDVSAPLSMKFPTDLSLPERLVLRILVDRGSIEVFADRGLVAMVIAAVPDEKNKNVELRVEGGDIIIRKMSIYRMKSSWEK